MEGRIDIEYDDGRTHESVQVAAEFTDWNPVPLGLDSGTRYAAVFDGAEAATLYHYKFIVDGQWALLPGLETAHDRAGNVNHFAVAKPVQSSPTQPQSGLDNSPQAGGLGAATSGGIGSDLGRDTGRDTGRDAKPESALGGGQFGAPAEAAARQGPESAEHARSTGTGGFQDLTGFKSDKGAEARSAESAQQHLSSLQLGSEPYEVVKDTPKSFSPSNRVSSGPTDSYTGAGAGTGASIGAAAGAAATGSTGYDYAAEFDRDPSRNFGGSSGYNYSGKDLDKPLGTVGGGQTGYGYSSKPDTGYEYTDSQLRNPQETLASSQNTGGLLSGYSSKPDTGYEYTDSQLSKPQETLTGTRSSGAALGGYTAKPDTGYEFTDSQLSEPKEALTGTRGASDVLGGYSSKPNTGYEYTEKQLLEPKEDVLEGLGSEKQTSGSGYGAALGSTGSAYGSESYGSKSYDNKGYDSSYNYKESQLADPEEAIGRSAGGYSDASRKPNTSYEYAESDLTKPKEKVSENFTTDDEYADAYEDASMPGSMPFERNVLGGDNVPGNALDTKASDFKGASTRPTSSGKASAGTGYTDSSPTRAEVAGDQSFYDSALEQLDEDDKSDDVFQETRDGLDETTGLPTSFSDRTISKTGGDYYGGAESGLDRSAAHKAVSDTVSEDRPSTPKERKTYEPDPYGSSYVAQTHQPIDVNTGFPVDRPEEYDPYGQRSSTHGHGNGPTLRNHEHRRSLKGRDRDPAAPPITSQEHRNAAVIAAASKASAFAKQDVAAISGRIETNRGQASPSVSRGASVRSSHGFSRSRESGQFNHSPSSHHTAPRQGQYSSATSSPTQAQSSYAQPSYAQPSYTQPSQTQPSQAQSPTAQYPQSAPSTQVQQPQSTQAQQQPRLTVATGAPTGTVGGGIVGGGTAAAAPPAAATGTNSESISSASSDASQLQRSGTKKEGRFKRLFKLR